MNQNYFKSLSIKPLINESYQQYLGGLNDAFETVKKDYCIENCYKLEQELNAIKIIKGLKYKDRKQIFKYFLQREVKAFQFLSRKSNSPLRILNATKCYHLEDYQLSWKEVWTRLMEIWPQVATKKRTELFDFLRLLRPFYDPNSALEVLNFFLDHHSQFTEMLFSYISLFSNISKDTSNQIVDQYLDKLLECYDKNLLKANELLVIFINILRKRKENHVKKEVYETINNIILSSLTTPSSKKDKKQSIESKFTKDVAIILQKIIGKANTLSQSLLESILQIIGNYIRPFEDLKKPVKFLYILLKSLSKRVQTQEKVRKRLQALSITKQVEEQEDEEQKEKEEESDDDQDKLERLTKQLDIEDDQEDDEDQDQKEKQQEMVTTQLKPQQSKIIQKKNKKVEKTPEQKAKLIEKYTIYLKNEISPEITATIKTFIYSNFQHLFFINSKNVIHSLLKYLYIEYPDLIEKSINLLEKIENIPQVNEEGLISSIRIISKYIFYSGKTQHIKENVKENWNSEEIKKNNNKLLENLLKVLTRLESTRKIIDIWDIIEYSVNKIPLLDEQDYEKVSEEDKAYFEDMFAFKHDRFYEEYSEKIFQLFKRLLEESQYFDKENHALMPVMGIIQNSYPFYLKRVYKEIQNALLETPNNFLFKFFTYGYDIPASLQSSIKVILTNLSAETEETLHLKQSLIQILSHTTPLKDLKKYIRQFSKKNKHRILDEYLNNFTYFNLRVQTANNTSILSTLKYFTEDPKFKYVQIPAIQIIQQKFKQLHEYSLELLEELETEVKNQQQEPSFLKDYNIQDFVLKAYGKVPEEEKSNSKNNFIEKRKNVNELLQILKLLLDESDKSFAKFDSESNTLQFEQNPTPRQSLLTNSKFQKIIMRILQSPAYLHDIPLMNNLTVILERQFQTKYKYEEHIKLLFQLESMANKNKNTELPNQKNLYDTLVSYGRKTKILLLSKVRNNIASEEIIPNGNQIDKILKILLIAPGNQKTAEITKLYLKKSSKLQDHATFILNLFKIAINNLQKIDTRFYFDRIYSLHHEFNSSGYKYQSQQILQIIQFFTKIFTEKSGKIRENGLKYFENFIKILEDYSLQEIEPKIREYLQKDKLQIIWLIIMIHILNRNPGHHQKDQEQLNKQLTNIQTYMRLLEKLIVSNVRIIRRLSLFIYSLLFRKAKKCVSITETIQISEKIYGQQEKQIYQFLENGYLRKEQLHAENVRNKSGLKKMAPYETYEIKKIKSSKIFQQIQEESFNFLIHNEENSLSFIKQFHTDMAASVEQLLSMTQHIKKLDLADIAVKMMERTYYFLKTKKLHYERVQLFFGERFFRYLMVKDSKEKYTFFLKNKNYVENCLSNVESLDNQSLILIFTIDLLAAYQKNYKQFIKNPENELIRQQIQKFVLKVIEEGIYKASGAIFKKMMLFFSKISNLQALQFILSHINKLIESKVKVSRSCQIVLTIYEEHYYKYLQVLHTILQNKIQLNNSFINILINTIILLPEKYTINLSTMKEFKIINVEKEIQNRNLVHYKKDIWIIDKVQFNSYFIKIMNQYINSYHQELQINQGNSLKVTQTQQLAETHVNHSTESSTNIDSIQQNNNNEEDGQKTSGIQVLKIAFNIITNAISTFMQSFETRTNFETIKQLVQLAFKLVNNKNQTVLDYKQLEACIKTVFNSKFENVAYFEELLGLVMDNIIDMPVKKQGELIQTIIHRPANFLVLETEKFYSFILKISRQEANSIYKELLVSLSTMMSYRFISEDEIKRLLEKSELKLQQRLLIQKAYVLSSMNLKSEFIASILKESTKQRRNIFCKEMLLHRGTQEYLDSEETYYKWKEIKQYSNPYHYHA